MFDNLKEYWKIKRLKLKDVSDVVIYDKEGTHPYQVKNMFR